MAPKSPRKGKKTGKKVGKKAKKTIITMPMTDSDEETQPMAPVSEEEEEGEEASHTSKRPRLDQATVESTARPPATVTIPTATVTSASTLSGGEAGEEEEEVSHPAAKKSSVADSMSIDKEQKLVDFFASNPIFYDQTLKEFKDKGRRDHLLTVIGTELGLTSKYKILLYQNHSNLGMNFNMNGVFLQTFII